jgi:glycolate oxidase
MDMARTLAPEALIAIVGARGVKVRPSELLVYTADGLPGYKKQPSVAVFPETRDQVVAVIRALAAAGVPFVPRGAGTGLSGGALADGVVLLGLNRLTRIISIDAANRPRAPSAGMSPRMPAGRIASSTASHSITSWR